LKINRAKRTKYFSKKISQRVFRDDMRFFLYILKMDKSKYDRCVFLPAKHMINKVNSFFPFVYPNRIIHSRLGVFCDLIDAD